jgi:hypothetical protein
VREPEKIYKKKNKKKGHDLYISRMRGGGTLGGGMMILGTFVEPPDVMNHANSHLHRMNSF